MFHVMFIMALLSEHRNSDKGAQNKIIIKEPN